MANADIICFMTPRLKKSSVEVLGIALGTVPLAPGVSDNVVNIH